MARALMTPDELRRMDNDLCIIFVKGLRPIKADKFYYFKHPMAKKLAEFEINHNDIGEIERGVWRKYNPYNPYVPEEDKEKQAQDLKIESLDDLFEDEQEENNENHEKESTKITDNKLVLNDEFKENNLKPKAPTLPLEEDNKEEYDLQKELEAKFD